PSVKFPLWWSRVAGREAGQLSGQPVALVLELPEGGLEIGELHLEQVLTLLQTIIPIGNLGGQTMDHALLRVDGARDRPLCEVGGSRGDHVEPHGRPR